jgi:hypothetical protein
MKINNVTIQPTQHIKINIIPTQHIKINNIPTQHIKIKNIPNQRPPRTGVAGGTRTEKTRCEAAKTKI